MPSEEYITKFQKLYYKEYNIKLSRQEAYDLGLKLINLVKIVYKPINKYNYDRRD